MLIHQHATPKKPERVVLVAARGFIGAAIHTRIQESGITLFYIESVENRF